LYASPITKAYTRAHNSPLLVTKLNHMNPARIITASNVYFNTALPPLPLYKCSTHLPNEGFKISVRLMRNEFYVKSRFCNAFTKFWADFR